MWAKAESLQNFKLKDEYIQKGMIQNTVLILWLVLSKRPQLQVVLYHFHIYFLISCGWFPTSATVSVLTCSFTHWIVVIIAPLWSFMTRIVAPFTGLLTVTRPFFPAERITWPVGGGDKKKVPKLQLDETLNFTARTVMHKWALRFKNKSFLWVFSLNKVT